MAHVVGVQPVQLDDAGRGDAAEILREIKRQEAAEQSPEEPTDPRVQMALDILADLPPRVRAEVLRRVGADARRQISREDDD
ncbi:hypothetical protein [Streptomyces sp. SID3212]|uniref:hypothetical protein n=1 Tax=Streptomyces sp. SID3212 TaxID=2690259 RepID=UPI001F1FD3E1